MKPDPVAPPLPSPITGDQGREWITHALAATIAILALLLLWHTLFSPDERFAQRKEVLAIATGLLGTVLGYYFGRAPAERRADQAERHVDNANTARNVAEQKGAEGLAAANVALSVLPAAESAAAIGTADSPRAALEGFVQRWQMR